MHLALDPKGEGGVYKDAREDEGQGYGVWAKGEAATFSWWLLPARILVS